MTGIKKPPPFSSQKAVDIRVRNAYLSIAELLKAKAAQYIIVNSSGSFGVIGIIQRTFAHVNRFPFRLLFFSCFL